MSLVCLSSLWRFVVAAPSVACVCPCAMSALCACGGAPSPSFLYLCGVSAAGPQPQAAVASQRPVLVRLPLPWPVARRSGAWTRTWSDCWTKAAHTTSAPRQSTHSAWSSAAHAPHSLSRGSAFDLQYRSLFAHVPLCLPCLSLSHGWTDVVWRWCWCWCFFYVFFVHIVAWAG